MAVRQYAFTNVGYVNVFAALTPTIWAIAGIDTVVRVGTGVYDLTLSGGGIDEKDCVETLTVRNVIILNTSIAISHVSDTLKRITISAGPVPVATDCNFSVRFDRVPLFS